MESLTPPLFISVVALAVVTYIIIQVLSDFDLYSKDGGFPNSTTYFFGTLACFCVLGMQVCIGRTEHCKAQNLDECQKTTNYPLLVSSLFYLFYILFTLNLTLRAEYYVNDARLPSTVGSFWLFLALAVLLYLLAYSPQISRPFLLFPIIWVMYLVWNWVNKI